MNLTLRQLHPLSFTPAEINRSDIWGKEIILNSAESHLLIAPSGSGKSSLTGFLYGFRNDFSSDLFFNDKNSASFSITDWINLRRNKLSVVFQDLRLFEQLTVDENLKIKSNLTKNNFSVNLDESCERLGISTMRKRKVSTLSMGQKQRVAILRALLQPFEFLLMDEPFSHLDPANVKNALELIHEACKKQTAGFLVTSLNTTHDFSYDKVFYL